MQLMIILMDITGSSLKLFIICVRFNKLVSVWFITVRLHKIFTLWAALFIVLVGERRGKFAWQTFVFVGWTFHTIKETLFPGNNLINFTLNNRQLTLPSLCSPSLEDVDDKADDNTHVGDEAEGHDVIPSGGGEYSVDEVLVVAIFANTRACVQLSVTVTREALKIFFTMRTILVVVMVVLPHNRLVRSRYGSCSNKADRQCYCWRLPKIQS